MSNFLPLEDDRYLKSHPGLDHTRREIARIPPADADYKTMIGRLVDVLRGFMLEMPPNSRHGLRDVYALLQAGRRLHGLELEVQRDLADIMVLSAADFLDR